MEKRHETLAFLSGRFSKNQLNWYVIEKEDFKIMATLTRMHWTNAIPDRLELFTNHNNLIIIFGPLSVVHDLSQTTNRSVLDGLYVYRFKITPYYTSRATIKYG